MAEAPRPNQEAQNASEKQPYENTRASADQLLATFPRGIDTADGPQTKEEAQEAWLKEYKKIFTTQYILSAIDDLKDQTRRLASSLPAEKIYIREGDDALLGIFDGDESSEADELYGAWAGNLSNPQNNIEQAAYNLILFLAALTQYERVSDEVHWQKQQIRRDKRQCLVREEEADKKGVPEYKIAQEQAAALMKLFKDRPEITMGAWEEEFDKYFTSRYLTKAKDYHLLPPHEVPALDAINPRSIIEKFGLNDYKRGGNVTILEWYDVAVDEPQGEPKLVQLIDFLVFVEKVERTKDRP
ncbi:MAG: hypothetical protein AAB588_01420 [Patescibacteria group bacterium]